LRTSPGFGGLEEAFLGFLKLVVCHLGQVTVDSAMRREIGLVYD